MITPAKADRLWGLSIFRPSRTPRCTSKSEVHGHRLPIFDSTERRSRTELWLQAQAAAAVKTIQVLVAPLVDAVVAVPHSPAHQYQLAESSTAKTAISAVVSVGSMEVRAAHRAAAREVLATRVANVEAHLMEIMAASDSVVPAVTTPVEGEVRVVMDTSVAVVVAGAPSLTEASDRVEAEEEVPRIPIVDTYHSRAWNTKAVSTLRTAL